MILYVLVCDYTCLLRVYTCLKGVQFRPPPKALHLEEAQQQKASENSQLKIFREFRPGHFR